jgi:hypothetical protein
VCDVEATTAGAGRAILSMLIHCRWIEKVIRRRGKMAEGCQTTVVGVDDSSLMIRLSARQASGMSADTTEMMWAEAST